MSQTKPMPTPTERLRSDILTGRLLPGERLMEIHLAEEYGCGRAAVRSALVELQTEGLVSREANRGATVRRISIEEAVQITEARSALECLVASRAAERATESDRSELSELVDRMRAAVAEDRQTDYSAMNRELHRRLQEIANHHVAAELIAALRNRAAHHQYRLSMMPGRSSESLEQHAAIIEAVVTGDPAAADQAMAAHLASIVDVLNQWGDVAT